jgi:pilus assembly protein CpaB
MRRGGRILILLGLILGMIAAGAMFLILSSQQAPPPQVATRSVVIAVQNIIARNEVTTAALGKAEYPENTIPPGAFDRIEDVSGKLALTTIVPGQIILDSMVIDKAKAGATRSNASFLIPDGKVAVEFSISALSGVGGAIQAGDYVDLMLTLTPGGISATATRTPGGLPPTEGQAVTQFMLQDVLILQVGQWGAVSGGGNQPAPQANILTFVMAPQDALALKSASEQGSIQMILRKAGDHKPYTTEPVNLEYLNRRFNFRLVPNR